MNSITIYANVASNLRWYRQDIYRFYISIINPTEILVRVCLYNGLNYNLIKFLNIKLLIYKVV